VVGNTNGESNMAIKTIHPTRGTRNLSNLNPDGRINPTRKYVATKIRYAGYAGNNLDHNANANT